MSSSLIWPIVLIVLSNVIYNICSKETPSGINPFAALSVTYIVGAFFSIVLSFLLNRGGNLLHEYRNLNWSSFILGLAVVGLEPVQFTCIRLGGMSAAVNSFIVLFWQYA